MSQLFARIYLDEDVSVLLASLLRSRGFEVMTTQESGNAAASDERQLEYAASDGLALLTHNRTDFCRSILSQRPAPRRDHYCGSANAARYPSASAHIAEREQRGRNRK
jgi:hypothetical protein